MDNTNKLIAEFMNIPHNNTHEYDMYGCSNFNELFQNVQSDNVNNKHFYGVNELRFHESWDWLMPVMDKIETSLWDISNFQSVYDRRVGRTETVGEINVFYDHREKYKGWTFSCGFSFGRTIKDHTDRCASRIEATYKATLTFIKWYNDYKKIPNEE